jgi:hypothetical protein
MTNEEPKITFESILQNWDAHYSHATRVKAQHHPETLELSATMRNPNTPAGTYPVFETYLGVDVLEKKRQLKQEKRRKRKEIRKNIFGFLKVVIPILLVAGAIIGGFMFFAPNTPQNNSGDIKNAPQVAEITETASPTSTPSVTVTPTAAPEGTVTPTVDATPEQKHCLTTPTKSPFLDGNGALHYGKGTGHDSYYVPANEDCGVRYTAEDGSSYHKEDDNSVGKEIANALLLITAVAVGMILLVMFIAILAI